MLTVIVAQAQNRAIGYKNQLLYHLSADLKRFKALTTGNTIIMGRNTFLSLPKGALPNRRNIVLSRQRGIEFPGCDTFESLEAALASCRPDEQVFIIGGAMLYDKALSLADRLCVTQISASPDNADAFFPEIKAEEWQEVAREHHEADERNEKPFDFVDYIRRKETKK